MNWTKVALIAVAALAAIGFFIWGILVGNAWAIAIPVVLLGIGVISGLIWVLDLWQRRAPETEKPQIEEVERFSLRARWLHWTIAGICIVMAITGIIFFLHDWWGIAAMRGYTRGIHRFFAVALVAVPLIYWMTSPKAGLSFIKEAFSYGWADLGWAMAALDYYFGGDESKMPPQGHVNPGQKLWELCIIVCGLLLVVTGAIMWFFKGAVSPGVFQWSLFTHDLAFIGGTTFFLVHFILGALHPRMTESLRSMVTGKISVKYAKSHYRYWYDEISKE